MKILAYKYDADYHCIDCTVQKFKQPLAINLDIDENGIGMEIEDSEGNYVSPLFDTDEWYELDKFYVTENPKQILSCGTCHKKIDSYTHQNYNGWANKETWNTNLRTITDRLLYYQVYNLLGNKTTGSRTTGDFAESLKMFLWERWKGRTPEGDSLKNVDWLEIAMVWQEDNKEYLIELDNIYMECLKK